MEYGVQHRGAAPGQGGWETVFDVSQAGEFCRTVVVVVPRELLFLTGQVLELEDPWSSPDSDGFQRGVFRLAVRSIEDALRASSIEPASGNEPYVMELNADDHTIGLVRQLALGDKVCSYQEHDGGNLFCTAAAANDETALPVVLNNGRRAAPTSRPLCRGCSLPDTDYICTHFLHPQVFGIRTLGGPSGFTSREVMDGMCDLNRPEFAKKGDCHAGGNECWERTLDIESAPSVEHVPAQAIEQALDDLDVRWRLAFGKPVVRLPGAEDVSVLALPCGSRDEFERRLSSLADIVKRLDVADDLFDESTELPEKAHTLGRLELLLRGQLPDYRQTDAAVETLRSINQLRAGGQHAGDAQRRRARAADSLGVPLDGRWSEAWERVRALAAQALRDIGSAARRLADAEA